MEHARRVVIGEGIRTRSVPLFPDAVIREVVINAVCHRDYRAPGPTLVKLYPDHLEVRNPGELPAEISVDALFRSHPSVPRNRVLVRTLAKARVVDEVGTGTLRMKRELEAAKAPPPEFVSRDGGFLVRLWASHRAHPYLTQITDRQIAILDGLVLSSATSVTDLATKVPFGRGTLLADLKALQSFGFVELGGQGRSARWNVTPQWNTFMRDWIGRVSNRS